MFLLVGQFVLQFNHSAPQGALSSQQTADQRLKIERKPVCAHNTWFYLHTTIIFTYIRRLFTYIRRLFFTNIPRNSSKLIELYCDTGANWLMLRKNLHQIRVTSYATTLSSD